MADSLTASVSDSLFNQSLEKGLAVLGVFDEVHRTLTLNEIAERAGMSKSSAQRTVHTLQVLGYVGKHPASRRFRLLPKTVELGFRYIAGNAMIRIAHPYLSELANASGESVTLTEPVGTDMVYVFQLATTKFMPILTPIGIRTPMYCTSAGRAYLSRLPEDQARSLLVQSERVACTPATLTQVEDIVAAVQECRRQGYAVNCEELFMGDMGIAAPIVNSRGEARGAVHVAPPLSRWSAESAQRTQAPLVMECARAISAAIGDY
ncbi:IclR family transcriptional regulator [Corticimicrobacter populi]|uniref:IclR family transcriptional regulator n=1 Tax=Corticimicrobacter populi TaxID=2175229 RepID=A0A2V1JUF2_9BURK|nr:IclR family transcriptional regulator [Corticimicrobacter populi]PWF21609.1 IclR family transcriptional regulator [Corticimicrobacter populi]